MKAQRINTRPGQVLEIVAPFKTWALWQCACSAAKPLGFVLGMVIIVRAADTTGWRGRWVDGRPK